MESMIYAWLFCLGVHVHRHGRGFGVATKLRKRGEKGRGVLDNWASIRGARALHTLQREA